MRKLFLLAIMLTGSFALANNVKPNVSSEIIEGTQIVTQTDVASVQNDVAFDYQYRIEDSFSKNEEVVTCYTRDCIIYNGRKYCTPWEEVPCNVVIIVVVIISPE